jgi:type I restriction enzyme S subunit
MGEWKEYKVSDLAFINNLSLDKDYSHKFIEYLDTGSVTQGKIDNYQIFNIEDAPSRAKRLVAEKDIIISSVRPIQRHYAILKNVKPNLVVSTGFVVLTCKESIDPYYLYYYLTQDDITYYLDSIAEGSTSAYPSLTPDVIGDLEISLPLLPEQRTIASVLSSLDDKIDMLHRQNKTLEQMAETLFRQWFVEEAEEEWEETKLEELGSIVCGKTPSKKIHSFFSGNIPFIKIPDMHGKVYVFESEDSLTEEGANSQPNKTLPELSICVSCIATVGLVCMNALPSQTNQQINSVVPHEESWRYYLYCKLKTMKDELLLMASGGTATDNLNTGDFSRIQIPKPPQKIINSFHEQIRPLFNKIFSNQIQIRKLTQMRDTLLPKLMSGEVRVKVE